MVRESLKDETCNVEPYVSAPKAKKEEETLSELNAAGSQPDFDKIEVPSSEFVVDIEKIKKSITNQYI